MFSLKAAEQIPPGVVVQNGVVSKEYFDFFLASHFGALVGYLIFLKKSLSLGHDTTRPLSRPSRHLVPFGVHVAGRREKQGSDVFQTVTYALAHLYARCPKSVSLPAPAYYAHLAAKRSRGHLNVLKK